MRPLQAHPVSRHRKRLVVLAGGILQVARPVSLFRVCPAGVPLWQVKPAAAVHAPVIVVLLAFFWFVDDVAAVCG